MMTTQKEIEHLYGRLEGWEEAHVLLLHLAGQNFHAGADEAAILLRDLAHGIFNTKRRCAEDEWREADPSAQPRTSDA